MIKEHLKEVLSKIVIFYNNENNDIAFTTPEFEGVGINEFHLLKNYKNIKGIKNIDYNYPYETDIFLTEDIINDIAMNIVLILMHENFGHKKYALMGNGNDSPKKIINKKNKLIELMYFGYFTPNEEEDYKEYILSTDKNKGDSGHFLELSYGKVDNTLITKLLFNMKNKGKLINRPDLFTDSGEKLKQYVSLRNVIEKNKLKCNFDETMSIEDEITQMENLISQFKKEHKKENDNASSEEEKDEGKKKLLNKKRNIKKDDDKENDGKSKPKLLKYYDIKNDKKEFDIVNESENYDKLSLFERIKNKSKEEFIEFSKQRVLKKFKFKDDVTLKSNMIKKFKETDVDDPYYYDLYYALTGYGKKV